MDDLKNYVKNDALKISNLKNIDVSRQTIYNFIKKNRMEKVGPGIYIMPDALEDEVYTLSLRCPQGIISHNDALYHYGLVDREPFKHSLTIYSGYNPFLLTASGYKVYTVKKEILDLGKIIILNQFGHEIPMYDLERTICDLVRSRNDFEIQDFATALKTYVHRKDKNLNRLMLYAKAFKIENKVREYMEVLL